MCTPAEPRRPRQGRKGIERVTEREIAETLIPDILHIAVAALGVALPEGAQKRECQRAPFIIQQFVIVESLVEERESAPAIGGAAVVHLREIRQRRVDLLIGVLGQLDTAFYHFERNLGHTLIGFRIGGQQSYTYLSLVILLASRIRRVMLAYGGD